jgi:hypothetical protein
MGLGERGRAERIGVYPAKEFVQGTIEVCLNQLFEAIERNYRKPVEKVLELVGDRARQQVLAQAENLSQFDIGWSETFQPRTKLDGKRFADELAVQEETGEKEKDSPKDADDENAKSGIRPPCKIDVDTAERERDELPEGNEKATDQSCRSPFLIDRKSGA